MFLEAEALVSIREGKMVGLAYDQMGPLPGLVELRPGENPESTPERQRTVDLTDQELQERLAGDKIRAGLAAAGVPGAAAAIGEPLWWLIDAAVGSGRMLRRGWAAIVVFLSQLFRRSYPTPF